MKRSLKNIDKFYHSPWIFILSVTIILMFSMVEIIPFMFEIGDKQTIEWGWGKDIHRHTSNAWVGWTMLGMSAIGGTSAVIGEISLSNNSKKYLGPITVGRLLMTAVGIMVQLWFLALTCFIYVVIGIVNCNKWDDEGSHLVNKMTIKHHTIITIGTITFIMLALWLTHGNGIVIDPDTGLPEINDKTGLPVKSFWGGESAIIQDPFPILDIIVAVLTITGWFNVSQKNKWGWVLFVLSDIGNVILYAAIMNMPLMACSSIYFIFDSIAAFRWFNWEYVHYNLADSLTEKYLDQ